MKASRSGPVAGFGMVGLVIGAVIGFLVRPQAMLVGQLPFSTVITRGATLKGLEELLIPVARTSFNYLLVGAIIGALVGGVVGMFAAGRK